MVLHRDFGGQFPAFRGGEEALHCVAQGQGDSPALQADQREAGADPPCAAGGVVAHRRPPPPRRLLALRGKGKQVTASATSRHSYCLRAGVRWQMKRVTAVPGPKQRQPRGSPSAGSGPLTARTRSHQRPVVSVDPCTFGGDIWTSGGTLHCGAILPEVYLGPHHTCRSLLVGTSHVGANPFQMLPVVCQKLLQDAAPTTVQPL